MKTYPKAQLLNNTNPFYESMWQKTNPSKAKLIFPFVPFVIQKSLAQRKH